MVFGTSTGHMQVFPTAPPTHLCALQAGQHLPPWVQRALRAHPAVRQLAAALESEVSAFSDLQVRLWVLAAAMCDPTALPPPDDPYMPCSDRQAGRQGIARYSAAQCCASLTRATSQPKLMPALPPICAAWTGVAGSVGPRPPAPRLACSGRRPVPPA